MAAFLLIGFLLLHTGFPAWAAWSLIGGSLLFFILYVIFKDMPPFVHYVLGLILGVVLLRAG
jgi:4-hydroxybenzoate polyprenyltransferase